MNLQEETLKTVADDKVILEKKIKNTTQAKVV